MLGVLSFLYEIKLTVNFFDQHNVFYVVGVGEHVYGLGGFAFIAVFGEKSQVTGLGFRIAGNIDDFFRLYFAAQCA